MENVILSGLKDHDIYKCDVLVSELDIQHI